MARGWGLRALGRLQLPVLLVVAGVAGCGGACTLAGCGDQIIWELPSSVLEMGGPITVTTCADGICQTRTVAVADQALFDGPELFLDAGTLGLSGPVEATVTVVDASGSVLFSRSDEVQLEERRPNGPGCAPTCGWAMVPLARRVVPTPWGNVLDCVDEQIAYTAGVDPPIAEAVGWDEPEQALAAYGELDRPPGTPGVETASDTEVVFVFTNPSGDRLGRVSVRLWPRGWFIGWAEKCGLEP